MKKILSCVLAVIMCISLTGCMMMDFGVKLNADGSGTVAAMMGFEKETYYEMIDEYGSEVDEDLEEFEYNGVTYVGMRENQTFSSVEELNSLLDSTAENAMYYQGQASAVTLKFEQNKDSTFNTFITLEAVEATDSSDLSDEDLAQLQELMKTMIFTLEFEYPTPVRQTAGGSNGVSISGNTLAIDLLKLGNVDDVLIFTTGSENPTYVKEPSVRDLQKQYDEVYPLNKILKDGYDKAGYVIVKDGKYGVADLDYNVIIEPKYNYIDHTMLGNMISVEVDGKCGLVDWKGNVVLPIEYEFIDIYEECNTACIENSDYQYALVDSELNQLVPYGTYEGIQSQAEYNMLEVFDADYNFGLISCRTGKVVLPVEYTTIAKVMKKVAIVAKDEKFGVVDYQNHVVTPFEYDDCDSKWVSNVGEVYYLWKGADTFSVREDGTVEHFDRFAGESFKAQLSTQKVTVNHGEPIEGLEVYNIDGSNYFKLRDLAYLLKDTPARFSVSWDNSTKAVSIVNGEDYTPVGGECEFTYDKSSLAKHSNCLIYIDGESIRYLDVFNIGDNNYFKLRDISLNMWFNVYWNSETNTVEITTATSDEPETYNIDVGSIDSSVIYDANGISITLDSISGVHDTQDPDAAVVVWATVKNNSGKTIYVTLDYAVEHCVNGVSYQSFNCIPATVENGDEGEFLYGVRAEDLSMYGIDSVSSLTCGIAIYDDNENLLYTTGSFDVKTSLYKESFAA